MEYFGQYKRKAQRKYRAFVEEGIHTEIKNQLESVLASTFLGSPEFVDEIKQWIEIRKERDTRNVPALKALVDRPSLDRIRAEVNEVVDARDPLYKKVGIYISRHYGGYSLGQIGGVYEMRGAAVSQVSRRFNQRVMEEPSLKALLRAITKVC
jgi:hypothetical protein